MEQILDTAGRVFRGTFEATSYANCLSSQLRRKLLFNLLNFLPNIFAPRMQKKIETPEDPALRLEYF